MRLRFARLRLLAASFLVTAGLSPGAARADTHTAVSLSAADVQAAMNAASAGDTVVLPAGTIHWQSRVSWAAPANVTIRGAGDRSLGGGDKTVIVDDHPTTEPSAFSVHAATACRSVGYVAEFQDCMAHEDAVFSAAFGI